MKRVSCKQLHQLITLAVLLILPIFAQATPSQASPGSAPETHPNLRYVVLDGQIEALTLTDRNPHYAGVDHDQLNGRHFQVQLNDFPDSKGRLTQLNGRWQGLIRHQSRLFMIRDVYDKPPASIRVQTLKSSQPIDSNTPLGTCATSLHPAAGPHPITAAPFTRSSSAGEHSSPAVTPPVTTQASTIADFAAFCDTTVDGVCLVAELSVMFDNPFISAFGLNYQDQAIAILEYVEFLYRDQFNIAFRHLSIDFENSGEFINSNDIGVVLEDISNQRTNNLFNPTGYDPNRRALFHLVSGKEYSLGGDTGVLGLAYSPDYDNPGNNYPTDFGSVLCSSFAAGTSQIVNDFENNLPSAELTALVVTHEIGHNFGFEHDGSGIASSCNNNEFIMGTTLQFNQPDQFSSCSRETLNANIHQVEELEVCFNFPVELGLLNSNTDSNLSQTDFIRTYTITASTRNNQPTPILVGGQIAATDGEFTGATLAGNACTLISSTEYRCSLNNASALSTLEVSISAQSLTFDITHELAPDPAPEGDIYFDTNGTNNVLVDTIMLNAPDQPPTSLTATISGKTLTLSWQDRATNELSYSVQRRESGGDWNTIADNLAANTETYQDSGVNYETEYRYRVIGHFPGDLQLSSEEATFQTGIQPNVKKRSSKGSLDIAFLALLLIGLGLRAHRRNGWQ